MNYKEKYVISHDEIFSGIEKCSNVLYRIPMFINWIHCKQIYSFYKLHVILSHLLEIIVKEGDGVRFSRFSTSAAGIPSEKILSTKHAQKWLLSRVF